MQTFNWEGLNDPIKESINWKIEEEYDFSKL